MEFLYVAGCDKRVVTLQEGRPCISNGCIKEKLLGMKRDALVTERMQQFIERLNNNDTSKESLPHCGRDSVIFITLARLPGGQA